MSRESDATASNLKTIQRKLIADVNNARDDDDWDRRMHVLKGWRKGVEDCGKEWDWVDADQHHEGEDAKRPMTLGVFHVADYESRWKK